MKHQLKTTGAPVWLWIPPAMVESSALDQLRNVAALPWTKYVAVMPDVHAGHGATIGSVIAMEDALCPAAVGVDIGCGVDFALTNLTREDLERIDLRELRLAIEAAIPTGFASREHSVVNDDTRALFAEFKELPRAVQDYEATARRQIGTMGGNNHFIEVCLDTEDRVWLTLHSGSRRIGFELAQVHMRIAKHLDHNRGLPDKALSVLLEGTPEMDAYQFAQDWALRYAALNRQTMIDHLVIVMKRFFPHLVQPTYDGCHHNYAAKEFHFDKQYWVTRKGALRAAVGCTAAIPGSMGTRSYIVVGQGEPDALESAAHGAGRRMSRGDAKKKFTDEDIEEQTRGVECDRGPKSKAEIAGNYKDIDEVMENQRDLVEVIAQLHAPLTIKG